MKLIITPYAEKKIGFFRKTDYDVTGILLGSRISGFTIVQDLLHVKFAEDDIENIFNQLYDIWKNKLKGFFFRNSKMFDSDVFAENLIMNIKDLGIDCYYCKLGDGIFPGREKKLIQHIYAKNERIL